MNPVILVSSCLKDQQAGNNQIIRDTWGKLSKFPVLFVMGDGCKSSSFDEVAVPAKDDYFSLPFKTQLGHKWAREHGYDWCFQAFTDTFVDPIRLAESGFTRGEYVGNKGKNIGRGFDFCHGGPGYWLSPRCSDMIIAAPVGKENLEDQWTAWVMKTHGVEPTDDKRYSMGTTYQYKEAVPLPTNGQISCHLSDSGHKYTKDMMIAAYKARFG